ncbi:Transposase [Popillia japonica]|uniref:Transposase n=1 Tax=Popillia japonica TaxID=7064 RepID=A0AAW1LEH4_POPJA
MTRKASIVSYGDVHETEEMKKEVISKKLKFSRCAVQTTIKRYNETRNVRSRPGRGPKRKTTIKENRWLQRQFLKNRRRTAKELSSDLNLQYGLSISSKTVSRRLREVGLSARKTRKKPLLSGTNKKKRLQWARKHQSWTDYQPEKPEKSPCYLALIRRSDCSGRESISHGQMQIGLTSYGLMKVILR